MNQIITKDNVQPEALFYKKYCKSTQQVLYFICWNNSSTGTFEHRIYPEKGQNSGRAETFGGEDKYHPMGRTRAQKMFWGGCGVVTVLPRAALALLCSRGDDVRYDILVTMRSREDYVLPKFCKWYKILTLPDGFIPAECSVMTAEFNNKRGFRGELQVAYKNSSDRALHRDL